MSFTAPLDFRAPERWPLRVGQLMGTLRADEGALRCFFSEDGRLAITFNRDDGAFATVLSSRLMLQPRADYRIAIYVSDEISITAYMSGERVAETGDAELIDQCFEPKPKSQIEVVDYSDENSTACLKRERFREIKLGSGRTQPAATYPFCGLQREALQLRDLISLVQAGQHHHIYGLAARLRLLLTGSAPLLQRCAGLLRLPLIVEAIRYPELATTQDRPMTVMWSPTLVEPGTPTASQVDIDIWLEWSDTVEGEAYPNWKVIRAIADTVGAHFDPGLHPLVARLEAMNGATEAGVLNELERWVSNLAVHALRLCEDVLHHYEAQGLTA